MIQVRGFGTAEVRVGEHRITPESEMLFALALFLAVTAGERVQRSRLLELFWPESSDGSRRHALRQLLYRLRRTGFAVELDGDEVLIEASEVDSDIQRALHASWPDAAASEDVVAAARVLPGFEPPNSELFREWLDELKSRIQSQYRRAILRQIASSRQSGRWQEVDEWARRCLEVDPLNEEATLARAEAVAMTGSKSQALEIIDAYLLELGDRDRVIGLPAKVLRRRVSENTPERVRAENDAVLLIGREKEVERLNEMLRSTLDGHGSAVFIVGAAGIGKSRLAEELLANAGLRGWRSVSARLQASDQQRPAGVFVDLFGSMLELPGALGSSPDSLSQLRILTEHSTADSSEGQRSQEPEAVRDRLRNAAMDLLEAVTSEGPVVVLIEDLQWCDAASSTLLQHLVSRSSSLPLFWMLTARPDGSYPALREVLSVERVETMRLGPLSAINSAELFNRLRPFGSSGEGDSTEAIAEAVTGGSPFFIHELAKHVTSTGQAASLPPTLRALIRDRAARLSPLARHVLHTCAVLGRYSTVARVSSVLEVSTSDLLASIDELDSLGIVGVNREADTLLLHDLWQDELLRQTLPAAQKLLHHRCGLILEVECRQSRYPSLVWEAARHLLASGSEGRALGLLEECAQHQLDNGLPADAARTFELAFHASTTDADKSRASTGRIAALKRASDWSSIASIIDEAVERAAHGGFSKRPHSDLELLQTEVMWRNESDPAASLQRALACAIDESATPGHRAHAALLSAAVADNLCRFDVLERVNSIARSLQVSTPEERASVLSVRLIHASTMASLEEAQVFGTQLISLEREAGSVRGLIRALRFASYPFRVLADYPSALGFLSEALEMAESHHLVGEAASAADLIQTIHIEREDICAAELWMERSAALAARVNARYARSSVAINRAILALLHGDHRSASSIIEPCIDKTLYENPLVRQRMRYLAILARIHIAEGDRTRLDAVAEALGKALELRRSTGPHDFEVASYAFALTVIEGPTAAESYVRRFVSQSRRNRAPLSVDLVQIQDKQRFNIPL